MADQQEPLSLASTFPNPPPFWKDFTPVKIARIEELRKTSNDDATKRLPAASVPDDLINLQPPPEPVDGRWRVFGDQYMLDDKLPTLEEQGIANLVEPGPPGTREDKHFDRAFELKRLAKSLLLNFLDLTGTLARAPTFADAKMQDLRTLFINMHHVINEYRPHQARESAIEMMQDHLDRTRAETAAIWAQMEKTRSVLEGLGSLGLDGDDGGADEAGGRRRNGQGEEVPTADRDAVTWDVMESMLAEEDTAMLA